MIQRWLAFFVALGLLLAGCAAGTTGAHASAAPAPVEPTRVRTLSLAAQTELSAAAEKGLDCFVRRVAELSDGALTVKITQSNDPIDALDEGCDLMFAPNDVIARANGNFNSYTSPFYFADYKHLSLSLNSESFQKLTGDATGSLLGAQSIGAFYDGNSVMVTIREEMLDTLDQFKGLKIYIGENALLEEMLTDPTLVGAEVTIRTPDARIAGWNSGRCQTIECDTAALTRLDMPDKRTHLNLSETFHAARINWMMLSNHPTQPLTEWERAVITEAVAYAIAANDHAVLAAEQAGLEHMKELGCSFYAPNHSEFCEATDKILTANAKFNNLWDWELHALVRKLPSEVD
ncbi:MAG: hypothetical protein RR320_00530 [Oscillospiraceae bacterium]